MKTNAIQTLLQQAHLTLRRAGWNALLTAVLETPRLFTTEVEAYICEWLSYDRHKRARVNDIKSTGYIFWRDIPPSLRTPRICLAYIKLKSKYLHLPVTYWLSAEDYNETWTPLERLVKKAKDWVMAFPHELWTHDEYLLDVVGACPEIVLHLALERQHRAVWWAALVETSVLHGYMEYYKLMKSVPKDVPWASELYATLVTMFPYTLCYIPVQYHTLDMVRQAFNAYSDENRGRERASAELYECLEPDQKTPSTALLAVAQDGLLLKCTPMKSRTLDVCLEAIRNSADSLYYVPFDLLDICLETLTTHRGKPVIGIPPGSNPLDIYTRAVSCNCRHLLHVPKEFRTLDVCLEAVKEYEDALLYIPRELMSDVLQRADLHSPYSMYNSHEDKRVSFE